MLLRSDWHEQDKGWLFPKQNEAPLLSRINGLFKGSKTGKGAAVSLEAQPGQDNESLQATKRLLVRCK